MIESVELRTETLGRALARTIADPDEIWQVKLPIKQDVGREVEKRNYVKFWRDEGKTLATLAVFKRGDDGWKMVTGFQVDRNDWLSYLNRQVRLGELVYDKTK